MNNKELKQVCPRCGKKDESVRKCLYCGQEWGEGPDIPTKPAVEPCDTCRYDVGNCLLIVGPCGGNNNYEHFKLRESAPPPA